MSRPVDDPGFATATNYAAGPYSGQVNKQRPPSGNLSEGFDPGTGIPTEWMNYLWANHGTWLKWLLTLPTTSSDAPQYQYQDAAGNTRHVFDHNGYMTGGRISQFREEWPYLANPLSPPQTQVVWAGTPWTYDVATGGAIAVQAPTASYNARYLQLTPPTTLGQVTALWGPQIAFFTTAGMSLVMEFEVGLNSAAAGTTSNMDLQIGLQDGTDSPGSNTNTIILYKQKTSATYQTLAINAGSVGGGGVVGATSPLTAPTAGTFPTDRVRIELQGSASPYGAYQARFFVNGGSVANVVAANLPGAVALRPAISVGCGGTLSGSPLAYIGPLSLMWNRYATGSTL